MPVLINFLAVYPAGLAFADGDDNKNEIRD